MTYLVTWEIEVDAETPTDAAILALEIMQDPTSTARVFKVRDAEAPYIVDLGGEE